MSTETQDIELKCTTSKGCDAIELLIQPGAKDLGEFSVRRTLPTTIKESESN